MQKRYYAEYLVFGEAGIIGAGHTTFGTVKLTEAAIQTARHNVLADPSTMPNAIGIVFTLLQQLDGESE